MKKFLKTIAALFAIPVALSAVAVYLRYMWGFAVSSFESYWSFWLGWVVCPLIVLNISRNNMGGALASRIYVIEHELTHALFALVSGARVKKISVKKDNGSVVVDKANTIITLAPYFFPLFAAVIFFAWILAAQFILNKPPPRFDYWMFQGGYFLVAFALSFHFFMTMRAVIEGQSDIKRDGAVYSFTVIFIVYVSVSALLMKFMFKGASGFNTLGGFFSDILKMASSIYSSLWKFFRVEIYPELKNIFIAVRS